MVFSLGDMVVGTEGGGHRCKSSGGRSGPGFLINQSDVNTWNWIILSSKESIPWTPIYELKLINLGNTHTHRLQNKSLVLGSERIGVPIQGGFSVSLMFHFFITKVMVEASFPRPEGFLCLSDVSFLYNKSYCRTQL